MHLPVAVPAIVMVISALTFFIGSILFLVEAFREHILWGLACVFLPIVALIFLCLHWKVAKRPFIIKMVGFVGFVGGIGLLFLSNGKFWF
jgi:hypothetical protein